MHDAILVFSWGIPKKSATGLTTHGCCTSEIIAVNCCGYISSAAKTFHTAKNNQVLTCTLQMKNWCWHPFSAVIRVFRCRFYPEKKAKDQNMHQNLAISDMTNNFIFTIHFHRIIIIIYRNNHQIITLKNYIQNSSWVLYTLNSNMPHILLRQT